MVTNSRIDVSRVFMSADVLSSMCECEESVNECCEREEV